MENATVVAEPPAALSFSSADLENLLAVTLSATLITAASTIRVGMRPVHGPAAFDFRAGVGKGDFDFLDLVLRHGVSSVLEIVLESTPAVRCGRSGRSGR